MARYEFTVYATLTLVNGDVVKTKIRADVDAADLDQAQRYSYPVANELINDLDCEKIDAPLDSYAIHFIQFDDEAYREV